MATSYIPMYLNQENASERGCSSSIKRIDRSAEAKFAAHLVLNQSEPRPRLALGDVSNNGSHSMTASTSCRKKTRTLPRTSDTPSCRAPIEFLLPKLTNAAQEPESNNVPDEGFEDIEIQPPNDGNYDLPDDFDDVWPVAERPSIRDLKWLMKWEPNWKATNEDDHEEVIVALEMDEGFLDRTTLPIEMPTMELETFAAEDLLSCRLTI